MDKDIPSFAGDLIPSIATYNQAINNYKLGIKAGDFYEEPIGKIFIILTGRCLLSIKRWEAYQN